MLSVISFWISLTILVLPASLLLILMCNSALRAYLAWASKGTVDPAVLRAISGMLTTGRNTVSSILFTVYSVITATIYIFMWISGWITWGADKCENRMVEVVTGWAHHLSSWSPEILCVIFVSLVMVKVIPAFFEIYNKVRKIIK